MLRPMLLSLFLVTLVVVPATAQPKAEQVKAAQKKVAQMVADRGGKFATITPITDKSLSAVFPEQMFFSVRFPTAPVALVPPKGFKSANVVVVSDDMLLFPDHNKLNKFFVDHFNNKKNITAEEAKQGTRAILVLFQELFQDGFYTFEILPPTLEKEGGDFKTNCRSIVKKGGNGEIKVMAGFSPNGGFKVNQALSLKPGPRPRCQATKLLDRDPIVRYMADAELRFLGVAALPYLRDQLNKADSRRLRRAIARLMAEIEAEGW